MGRPETDTLDAAPARAEAGGKARIQSCGFLVALRQDWQVTHVSDNIADHFADCGSRMIGQPLADFFGAGPVHSLRNQLALMRDPGGSARLFSSFFAGVPKPFDVAMHVQDGIILLEAMPAGHFEAGDPAGTVRQLAGQLDGCADPAELQQRGCHLLRALVGFDSVTLFRFDGNGEGEPVAEDSRSQPAIAARCPPAELRLLADAGRGHALLEPDAPPALVARALLRPWGDEQPGVGSALSVQLVSAGRSWGVALCLNRGARKPMLDRIAAAELFGDLLAMRFELAERRGG